MSEKPVHQSMFARRDFLKLGSVAVAGLAGGSWQSLAFGALVELPKSTLSAGFSAVEPKEGEMSWLTPADRLLSGDAQFISRDARVTMRSSARATTQTLAAGEAAIDVIFPALGYQPEAYPTYKVWSYRRDAFGEQSSGAVRFRVPIDVSQGLRFVLTTAKQSESSANGMLSLGLSSARGTAKLQRGIYVIAYGDTFKEASPNWAAVPMTRRGKDIIVPDAKFSYFVLSIDYAS